MAGSTCADVNLKLGHAFNEQDVFHTAAFEMQKIVKAESKGKFCITHLSNAKFGDGRDHLESLKIGTVYMAIVTGGPII